MTDKKLKTKKRLLQKRVSFNNDMTMARARNFFDKKDLSCDIIVKVSSGGGKVGK